MSTVPRRGRCSSHDTARAMFACSHAASSYRVARCDGINASRSAGSRAQLRVGRAIVPTRLPHPSRPTVVARWRRRRRRRLWFRRPQRTRTFGGQVAGKFLDLVFHLVLSDDMGVETHRMRDAAKLPFGLSSCLPHEHLMQRAARNDRVHNFGIHRVGCLAKRTPRCGPAALSQLELQNRLTGYPHPCRHLLRGHAERLAQRPYPPVRWRSHLLKIAELVESFLELAHLNSAKSFVHMLLERSALRPLLARKDERKNNLSR